MENWQRNTERALQRLLGALQRGASDKSCLARWSEFIRTRDDHRCVACGATSRLAAHHICRKSFLEFARFEPGNGITLCPGCHEIPHAGFNRRPDMNQPMDAQGGEKLDMMTEFYEILLKDAVRRGTLRVNEYYYLSERTLRAFRRVQGFDSDAIVPGNSPLEQAFVIWRQCPQNMMAAILRANGVEPLSNAFLRTGATLFVAAAPPESQSHQT